MQCFIEPPKSENGEPQFYFSQRIDADGDIMITVRDRKGLETDLFYLDVSEGFKIVRVNLDSEFFCKYGEYFDTYLDYYLSVDLKPEQ